MICKMCLEDKKLVNAHIIPESFYRYMKPDSRPLEIYSNVKGEYKRKSPIGIYDQTILCEDCEKLFQIYDDYAQYILLSDIKEEDYILGPTGNRVGYKLENIDYNKLKLFFVSVLWRASTSSRKEFSKINVASFETALKEMIKNNDPRDKNIFSVIITKFGDFLGKNFLLDPHNNRIDGINFCRFYLGAGYKIYIKVDRRPLSESEVLNFFVLKPNQPLYIMTQDLRTSKELPLLKSIINDNHPEKRN